MYQSCIVFFLALQPESTPGLTNPGEVAINQMDTLPRVSFKDWQLNVISISRNKLGNQRPALTLNSIAQAPFCGRSLGGYPTWDVHRIQANRGEVKQTATCSLRNLELACLRNMIIRRLATC